MEYGEIEFSGSMSLERAESLIIARVMSRDSLFPSSWLPSKLPPPLACSLKRILALPVKLKSTATTYRGQPGFYTANRAKFVHTDKILAKFTKSTFPMDQLIRVSMNALFEGTFLTLQDPPYGEKIENIS